jgi:hypothetical protein
MLKIDENKTRIGMDELVAICRYVGNLVRLVISIVGINEDVSLMGN